MTCLTKKGRSVLSTERPGEPWPQWSALIFIDALLIFMDFSVVVERARQLVTSQNGGSYQASQGAATSDSQPDLSSTVSDCATCSDGSGGRDVIYGRVCTTAKDEPPPMLSSDTSRKSVFLFGPDAVETIILKQAAYNILCSIGRDRDYLYHMVPDEENRSSCLGV